MFNSHIDKTNISVVAVFWPKIDRFFMDLYGPR